MADINGNALTNTTSLGSNDSAVLVDQTSNEGKLIDLDVLADKVLDRISSKTFANQVGGSSAATLLAQLSTLNTNKVSFSLKSTNDILSDVEALMGQGINKMAFYYCSGGNYIGTLPSSVYNYSTGIAMWRGANSCSVILFPEMHGYVPIINHRQSGTWQGWRSFANNTV